MPYKLLLITNRQEIMETLASILNRLAIEHLNRETAAYIQKLEKVANTAKLTVENGDLTQLKKVLMELDVA